MYYCIILSVPLFEDDMVCFNIQVRSVRSENYNSNIIFIVHPIRTSSGSASAQSNFRSSQDLRHESNIFSVHTFHCNLTRKLYSVYFQKASVRESQEQDIYFKNMSKFKTKLEYEKEDSLNHQRRLERFQRRRDSKRAEGRVNILL